MPEGNIHFGAIPVANRDVLMFPGGTAMPLSALHMDSALSGDVWGIVTLALKIQTS